MTRLVLVRHGRTTWNAEGRFQGHADPPLDPTGARQAREMAHEVAALAPRLVLCSDLRRARSTAEPLAARCGAPLVVDPALREIDVGTWAGLTRAEIEGRYPEQYRAWAAGRTSRRGGGETEAEAGRRAATCIATHLTCLDAGGPAGAGGEDPTLAVVAHGVVLRAALEALVASGTVEHHGPPPHLENGAWLVLHACPTPAATS